ncbi:MAG: hypothetical protein SFU53_14280 [Terrimicrobiaceae bacterium]|nr:hypothetical protein [Terrimicrobiaceae bacterium]
MRTTLTIEDDIAAILEDETRRKGMSFKEVVNATLRRGLEREEMLPPREPVMTRPHAFGFKAGVDLDKLNQLVDELEAEEVSRRSRV